MHFLLPSLFAMIQFGEINRLADDAIKTGKIPPMIIVTPDGFTSFYIKNFVFFMDLRLVI